MNYFDLTYIFLFLPIVIIVYNIMPKKIKPAILLLASFVFFFMISKFLIAFLLLSILSVYLGTRWMSKVDRKRDEVLESTEKEQKKEIKNKYRRRKKLILILVILFNILIILIMLMKWKD